ncbi:MAG TPA: hypothetical protein VD966_12725 [Pyrinomonadaceae bacterium]|nr:hypothetical protein [Pyrinomonadaceae bacterium]
MSERKLLGVSTTGALAANRATPDICRFNLCAARFRRKCFRQALILCLNPLAARSLLWCTIMAVSLC